MNAGEKLTCCYVMGNKRAGLLFSIHESGTQIVLGGLEDESFEKRKNPLLFRQHIYLNPVKMMREYKEAEFEPLATLCVRRSEHLQGVEMYLAARRAFGANTMNAMLRQPTARPLLDILLNMEGHDDESRAMQAIADDVHETMEKLDINVVTTKADNHAE